MDKKLSITDLQLQNRRVLIRVDFNVPLDDKGNVWSASVSLWADGLFSPVQVTSTQRIDAAVPTIKYALDHGMLPCSYLFGFGNWS
jgi:phosphoglycerate kinase